MQLSIYHHISICLYPYLYLTACSIIGRLCHTDNDPFFLSFLFFSCLVLSFLSFFLLFFLSLFLSFFSFFLSFFISLFLSFCVCFFLLEICLYIVLVHIIVASIYGTYLSIIIDPSIDTMHPPIYLSIHPSINLSIHLPIRPSLHSSIYLWYLPFFLISQSINRSSHQPINQSCLGSPIAWESPSSQICEPCKFPHV